MGIWTGGVVGVITIIGYTVTGSIGWIPSPFGMVLVSLLQFASVMLVWVLPVMLHRRFQQTVRALRHEVCLGCAYRLHGLPDDYRCPECGTPYNKDDLRDQWETWFATRRV